jgi:hypothetical protein
MRRSYVLVLPLVALATIDVANATVGQSIRQRVNDAQWIVVARILSTKDSRFPHRYQVAARVRHVLKGSDLPQSQEAPGVISFAHIIVSPFEGPDFRRDWPSRDFIFFLRLDRENAGLCLTDEWFGVESITPKVIEELSDAGVDVWPLVAPQITSMLGVALVLVMLVGVSAALTVLLVSQRRRSRTGLIPVMRNAEPSDGAESR